MNRILKLITRFLPCRLIKRDGVTPYLYRYYICSLFGRTFYLHEFLKPDDGDALHNHPWDESTTLVLSGGYIVREALIQVVPIVEELRNRNCPELVDKVITGEEHRLCLPATKRLVAGNINRIPGNLFHCIAELLRVPTWTLFWHTNYTGSWYFYKDGRLERYAYDVQDGERSGRDAWWRSAPRGWRSAA